MFSIIVSEKGGAERRTSYDRTEISVGRVQGNDLMLPKGNVSKRHARLLYRDGRFIVTDLKSTNGTYVNGRKISQATIVREGDKIYIGDFILRIESAAGTSPPGPTPPPDAAMPEPGGILAEPTGAPEPAAPPQPSSPSSAERGMPRAIAPRIDAKPTEAPAARVSQDIISHFPLEQDPDDSAPAYQVPGPPRMPSSPRGAPLRSGAVSLPAAPATSSPLPSPRIAPPPSSDARATPLPGLLGTPAMPPAAPLPPLPIARRAIPPAPELPTPAPATGLHRRALAALIERASSTLDAASLDAVDPPPELVAKVDAALADLAAQLRAAGALPSELHADALIAEAKRELLESGPLGPLLDDEEVSEIQVIRHDFVLAMQGRRQVAAEVAFTSEPALARALRRLCAAAGKPLEAPETYVERRLRSGARLFAVVPPAASQGHMLVLRKPQRADLSLEDLVRSGTISRAMATLFGACMTAHANVLITGSTGSGTTSLLGALASAGSTDDRVVVLQEDDELILSQPHAFSILVEDGEDGVRALHAAARLQPDRVVVGAFGGRLAAEVVDAIGDGVHGVLAAARAPTLRQAILRLPADLAATRAGLTPEAAREWLASAFDVAIEIARLKDGRHRVMRVAELSVEGGAVQARDVFTFTVERTAAGGAIEGTFSATGVVPKLVDDLTARGIAVDPGIFRRNATR